VGDFPEWWDWELFFTDHTKIRLEERDLTELEVRAMLQRANGYRPDPIDGRFQIDARYRRRPWIVAVEPNAMWKMLVIVTVYEDK
jgi:hypothetical protein